MEFLSSRNLNRALVDVISKVKNTGRGVVVRNGQKTTELASLVVNIEQPRERCLINLERKNNIFASIAETCWVMAGRNDVEFLSNYLPRAIDFSDDGETWRAGYGPRLRNWNGIDQVKEIYKILKDDPTSRRAVITLYDPDRDFTTSKDIPCNNWLHFMIRDGNLNLDVAVRSNDVIWGFSAINVFEWSVLLEMMAHWLEVDVGRLTFFVSSMHIYDRHDERAGKILSSNAPDIYETDPKIHDFVTEIDKLDTILDRWFELEANIRTGEKNMARKIAAFPDPLLQAYLQMLDLYWALKRDANDEILIGKLAPLSGSDLELSALEYIRRTRPEFEKDESHLPNKRPAGLAQTIILVEGADQTGKTTLINELMRQLGEDNCAYFHNVLYGDFIRAHSAILDAIKEVRDKPYILVDRWHLTHVVYGQVFHNGQYDESSELFSDIDTCVDKVIICALADYDSRGSTRNEAFPHASKQARANQLFREYYQRSGDERFTIYDYKQHMTTESLRSFVEDIATSLDDEKPTPPAQVGHSLTIGVDLDDTIFDFATRFVNYSNTCFNTNLTVDDYNEHWSGPSIWGKGKRDLSHPELMRRFNHMIDGGFYATLKPLENAYGSLRELKNWASQQGIPLRLVALSNRSADNAESDKKIKSDTLATISQYFPDIFDDYHFINVWGGDQAKKGQLATKSEACREYAIDYLIDDQPKHIEALGEAPDSATKTVGILFGPRPETESPIAGTPYFEVWGQDMVNLIKCTLKERTRP